MEWPWPNLYGSGLRPWLPTLAFYGMPPFLYRCPTTGYRVQGFIAEELPADTYEAVACTACRRIHLVNPTTGKVLGEDDK
jgi:hypothetical protein